MQADPDIAFFQRLGSAVTTSGRLVEADVAALAALGVRHVINLALASHPEALPDEEARFAAEGIGYTHIPVPFDAPGDSHFAAFRVALEAAPRPVHVHCIMNWRVSAMFCRYNRDEMGMDAAAARAIMQQQWDPQTSDYPDAAAWARFLN